MEVTAGFIFNYFFEEMVTQAVLRNTVAGITSGSVASAIHTDDRFSSIDCSELLSSHASRFRQFLRFPYVPNTFEVSSEISPTRCNNCVFILRNGFTLHVSGDNLTHHQEYICCIWPQ